MMRTVAVLLLLVVSCGLWTDSDAFAVFSVARIQPTSVSSHFRDTLTNRVLNNDRVGDHKSMSRTQMRVPWTLFGKRMTLFAAIGDGSAAAVSECLPSSTAGASVNINLLEQASSDGHDTSDSLPMPSKSKFEDFFNRVATADGLISLDQLCSYDEISQVISEGYITKDDMEFLLDHGEEAIPAATPVIGKEAGYELLCAAMDLPDPETVEYLNQCFAEMCTNQDPSLGVSFEKFAKWGVVGEVRIDGVLNRPRIKDIWADTVESKSVKSPVDRKGFVSIYRTIEDIIDLYEDDGEEEDDTEANTDNQGSNEQQD
jgi:hypothetical protein